MALLDRYFGELTKLGYSPAQAAGILGNLQTESKLDPNAVGDKGTSYGIAQWHNERKAGLDKFAASKGLLASDPLAQIQYLDWELKNREPRANQALQAAKTPQEAAAAFLHFERPQGYSAANPLASLGADQRVANAVNIAKMSGATPQAAPSQVTPAPPPFTTQPTPQPPPSAVTPAPPETVEEGPTPQYDTAAMRGLLARLFQEEQPTPIEPASVVSARSPATIRRGRGLAFHQLTVKTPRFA